MLNADEHKKLLEQIKELEKNSINYFDVEKEFFLIDSNNLSQIRPKLYGYSIQRNGIYEDDNLTEDAAKNLDGRGCYVYVDVKDGQITIKQDLNGCWGIYLFRHGDYFALSNSFFRLLDHVKFKYPLTVNRDYCHLLLTNGFCSFAYSETAVNEIQLVERNAILYVDIAKKQLEIDMIDYKEDTVPLDSEEGIATLDNWIEFWDNVMRGVAQNTKFITTDLSGGFDSRIAFIVALHSGINLDEMRIFSIKSTSHTYKEDYEIASYIAEHYNFKLNQPFPSNHLLKLSLSDAWNIHLYCVQPVHVAYMLFQKPVDKIYRLTGYGGEMIRDYWLSYSSLEKWTQGFINTSSKRYSDNRFLEDELVPSIETIIKSGFRKVRDKYKIEDQNSLYILQYFYNEARGRHHFGKMSLNSYFKNEILISPMLDPLLRTLKLNTPECLDYKLLMTLLFTRYEPDLLTFPFDSDHSIKPETIEYAKKINERFPHRIKDVAEATWGGVFYLQPRDLRAEKILTSGKNNPLIPRELQQHGCLKSMFESSRIHGLFTTYFNYELYDYAAYYYDNNTYYQFKFMDMVVGVTKVLEDVEISQRNYPLYRDIQRFLEQDFCLININEQISDKFKPYFTARIRVNSLLKEGDFQILSVSDKKAEVNKPDWLQRNGTGYIIFSIKGNVEIIVKASVSGKIQLTLAGKRIIDSEDKSKNVPYWIDFNALSVNGKAIFDNLISACYDKPYIYTFDAQAGEEIKIQVEWLPHRSDT